MAYTATKYFNPRAFAFPGGFDNTQHLSTIRGVLVDCDTATEYTPGGIGSTSFEITAFSAVGLVTYSSLKGMPLYNGQTVVVYNTSSNTNDGTYTVASIATTSTTAGTFTAVPVPPNALSGTGQTGQTAEGVGQIQWSVRQVLSQTFTATAVAVSGSVMTVTYTTFTGPQLQPGDSVLLSGMTNTGNNGTFSLVTVTPTSSTAGSFTVLNTSAVASDSGTGTGNFTAGIFSAYNSLSAPIMVKIFTNKGYVYYWNSANQTIQVFLTGASSGAILAEAALGATLVFDSTAVFEANFIRAHS